MTRGIKEWKRLARMSLKGNYAFPVLALVISTVVSVMGNSLTSGLFPGTSASALILSQIFAFILSLVISVFTAGISYLYLNIARRKSFSFSDLLYFFKNQPDRVIIATLVLTVIDLIVTIPVNYYGLTADPGTTMEEYSTWAVTYLGLLLGAIILNMLLTLPFVLVYYLLADEPQLSGFQALKESMKMMKGHIGRYLLLQISFLPWMIASMFTFYIALLWLLPYMEMSAVMFYRDLRGELDTFSTGTPAGAESVTRQLLQEPEDPVPGDDYNAEA